MNRVFFSYFFPLLLLFSPLFGEGKVIRTGLVAKEAAPEGSSSQELFSSLLDARTRRDWKALSNGCWDMIRDYSETPFAMEATYLLGVAYFEMEDYDMANHQFSEYLSRQSSPKHFEEAIHYKFEIAEKFRLGERKHLLGFKSMPKWAPAGGEALSIYEEVISALPHHDLSAHSLYGKGQIHMKNGDFRAGIEAFQTVIRRFPKHPLAVESYVGIGQIYLLQSKAEYPDANLLDLAELNLKKFRGDFPREGKIAEAQEVLGQMRDHFAGSLYETARFYERTKKWGAAKIYYQKLIQCYPESKIVTSAKERLVRLEQTHP